MVILGQIEKVKNILFGFQEMLTLFDLPTISLLVTKFMNKKSTLKHCGVFFLDMFISLTCLFLFPAC